MLKRSHIRQFLAVADAGSFTQAAARIRVTQPTLSSGIAELERLIGAKLFVRDRKRVRMTDAGARLLPIARDLEARFLAADAIGQTAAAPAPAIRLGMLRSVSTAMVRSLVGALPVEVELEMIEGGDGELRQALASGRADLIVTVLRASDSGRTVAPLLSEPYLLLVSSAHRLATAAVAAPEDLAGEVMIARRACELLAETSRFFTRRGVRPRFSLRSDNEERCMALVSANRGITTAPLSLAVDNTVPVRLDGYDFDRTIGLIADPDWLANAAHAHVFASLAAQSA